MPSTPTTVAVSLDMIARSIMSEAHTITEIGEDLPRYWHELPSYQESLDHKIIRHDRSSPPQYLTLPPAYEEVTQKELTVENLITIAKECKEHFGMVEGAHSRLQKEILEAFGQFLQQARAHVEFVDSNEECQELFEGFRKMVKRREMMYVAQLRWLVATTSGEPEEEDEYAWMDMMNGENPEGLEQLEGVLGMDSKSAGGSTDSSAKQERAYIQYVYPSGYTTILTSHRTSLQKRTIKSLQTFIVKRKDTLSEMDEDFRDVLAEYTKALPDAAMSAQKLHSKARSQSSMKAAIDRFARRQRKVQNDLADEMEALFQAYEIAVKRGVLWSEVVISQNRYD